MRIVPSPLVPRFAVLLLASVGAVAASAAEPRTPEATDVRNAPLAVTNLRCEYETNPPAVESPQPELSWWLASAERGQRQTAYQVQVASTVERLNQDRADLWDSGKVESETTAHVAYAGRALRSEETVHWRVRVWGKDGQPSRWSPPASWTAGLLDAAAWRAQWISGDTADGPLPIFRREFAVAKPVRRATVHVCGLGFYELRLNGRKVGDNELDSGWTNYRKRCLYTTYDLTGQIQRGANAFGVLLGNGMYNVRGGRYTKFTGSFGPPKLILQLHLEFEDGSTKDVLSDAAWKTAPGPITFSCIYGGEDYDARRELPGRDRDGFDDRDWRPAQSVKGPGGKLVARTAPPLRAMRAFPTIRVTEPKPGVLVYDLGQNFSGWPQLKVRGPAGKTVKLVTGELLDNDGLVSQRSSGSPVWFSYTLKGEGVEAWHPRFSYSGFRYVQVEGATRDPATGDTPLLIGLEGQFVHSSARVVGEFACSNPLLNRIHDLIDRAIESNLQSVLTDCPHREKLGWLEVSHLLGPAIVFNYDVPQLYRKICDDMADSQLADGLVPDIAPEYVVFGGGFRDSPEWGSAFIIVPWQQYEWTGDTELLRRHFDAMKRYVGYLGSKAKDHIVSHGLGDWYDLGPKPPGEAQLTPKALTATAFYYYDTWILAQTAALLGKADDARDYTELAAEIRAAFNRTFFKPDAGVYATGSQCANAMPLVMGIVEPAHRAEVLEAIVKDVQSRGNALTAGDVGYRYLLRALADGGRSDVILAMNNQSDKPGYGYQLKHGATSLTEAWDAGRGSSQNHFMLGHIIEWFYRDLAGIGTDGPGYQRILIKPALFKPGSGSDPSSVNWVRAAYTSVHGKIVVFWKRAGDRFELGAAIPANTTATIYLPAKDAASVTEGGRSLERASGVKVLRMEDGRAVLAVESGNYRFSVKEIR